MSFVQAGALCGDSRSRQSRRKLFVCVLPVLLWFGAAYQVVGKENDDALWLGQRLRRMHDRRRRQHHKPCAKQPHGEHKEMHPGPGQPPARTQTSSSCRRTVVGLSSHALISWRRRRHLLARQRLRHLNRRPRPALTQQEQEQQAIVIFPT